MRQLLLVLLASLLPSSAFSLEFSLPKMNGEPGEVFNSEDNHIYVLEFFFNGCPYCHENEPNIESLSKEFSSDPVHVLDIGRDCRNSDYKAWISRHPHSHPVLKDCQQDLISRFQVSSYPTTVVIDCSGNVVSRKTGAMSSGEYHDLVSLIRSASDSCVRERPLSN